MVDPVELDLPAVFARGGTSKGLVLRGSDLPPEAEEWPPILLSAMGSPDPFGRQLNGMGGGLSSLSKVCVIDPSSRPDVDVEYTFVQVQIRDAVVDFSGNCGNMSSVVGPVAVDLGLVEPQDGLVGVRMLNRNTDKIVVARFEVLNGQPVLKPRTRMEGVQGHGTEVTLDFLDPGGASTGRLLPTGQLVDSLVLSDGTTVEASLIDASNACVFVAADSLGMTGSDSPSEIERDVQLLERFEEIRRAASVRMGISPSLEAASKNRMTPLIAAVTGPVGFEASDGTHFAADDTDVTVRFLSNGQPHRAVPATGAMSTAAAALIPGSLVAQSRPKYAEESEGPSDVRIGHPSGITSIDSHVTVGPGGSPHVVRLFVHRTMRRLFTGIVHAPLPGMEDVSVGVEDQ